MKLQDIKIGQVINYQWHNEIRKGKVLKVLNGVIYVREESV
jgi:hypothetical protein